MRIIDRIDKLINERGITSKQLAQEIGVSQGNISDWRKDRSKPSSEVLKRIAEYFNVSIDFLYGYSENQTQKTESRLTSKEIDLLREMRNSDKKHIKALASTIDKLLEEGDRLLKIADHIADNNSDES